MEALAATRAMVGERRTKKWRRVVDHRGEGVEMSMGNERIL